MSPKVFRIKQLTQYILDYQMPIIVRICYRLVNDANGYTIIDVFGYEKLVMGQQEDVSSQGKASVRYYIRMVDDGKLTWVIKVSVYDSVKVIIM